MTVLAAPVQARPRAVLTAAVLAVLSYGLMQTMVVPTAGVLRRELHTSATAASWAVLSSTLLVSAVVTPVAGRLGDRYGQRRVLLGCLLVYLVGTVGAAAAPGIGVLIGFRAVQGISLALLPLAFAVIRESVPAELVPGGLAITSGLVGGTAGAGLLAGGLIVDHLSWRWLFVVGTVLVLVALVAVAVFVPDVPGHGAGRIDLAGALALAAGLTGVLLALTQGRALGWASPWVLGLFAGGAVAFGCWVLVERRVAHPMVDLALLTRRRLAIAHVGALTLGANQFLGYVLLPELAGRPEPQGFGVAVTGVAVLLLPGTLAVLAASWWAARRPGTLLGPGLVLAAAGTGLLFALPTTYLDVVLGNVVCGLGYGITMAALPRLVAASAPVAQNGSANSVNTVSRTVGGALGSQCAVVLMTGSAGIPAGFLVATAVAAVGAVVAFVG